MLATIHRFWPLAGLTLALVATVGWIALLGYVAIKLFRWLGRPWQIPNVKRTVTPGGFD